MAVLPRLYEPLALEHFRETSAMLFLTGPRQVGKTTTARRIAERLGPETYLDWDDLDDRERILAGPAALARALELDRLQDSPPVLVLDEIHRFRRWKVLLKGFHDRWKERVRVIVTGSARLDLFRRGGESLLGRWYGYRLHPLSVGELVRPAPPAAGLLSGPAPLEEDAFVALRDLGGFPEPFLRGERRFRRRWERMRWELLLREDLRDLSRVHEVDRVELLAELLRRQVGSPVRYQALARAVRAAPDTVIRWTRLLEALHLAWSVRPWYRSIPRSLRKEPRVYLWDWASVPDEAARAENMIGSALLKAAHLWTDRGEGEFALHWLRDKEGNEVDFCLVRDGSPWLLVEVKLSGRAPLSPALARYQRLTGAPYAFQVAMDLPFVDRDPFAEPGPPLIVPARTFLSCLP